MKVSYIVPGNWADIDLNGDLVEQTRQVGDRFMTYLGQSGKTEQVRDLIDRQFRSQAEALKQAGATNFLVEVEPTAGVLAGASMFVVPLPLTDDVAPMDAMLAIGRDGRLVQVGGDGELINTDLSDLVHTIAGESTPRQTLARVDHIETARRRLIANGNPLLVLEDMTISLRPQA